MVATATARSWRCRGRSAGRRTSGGSRGEAMSAIGPRTRVERRLEELEAPGKQPKRGRLWLNDGSCVRLRPERPNHVWSYDFVEARTHDGRSLRLLTMIDEYTRQCLAIRVARRLNSYHVIETLGD